MFNCVDCGINTGNKGIKEYYMVNNDIWNQYGAGYRMLCIGCLERRMGRKLERKDFMDCPLNFWGLWWTDKSERYLDRLNRV